MVFSTLQPFVDQAPILDLPICCFHLESSLRSILGCNWCSDVLLWTSTFPNVDFFMTSNLQYVLEFEVSLVVDPIPG